MAVIQRCDFCKQDIEGEYTQLYISKINIDEPTYPFGISNSTDICQSCEYILNDWLKEMLEIAGQDD